MEKVIVLTGPTSIGKTKLSLDIAKKYGFDIINCDASSFKRELNIGTAKPSEAEQSMVKHHFIDIIDPISDYSTADYQRECRKKISEINSVGKCAFMVGGSGLYISSTLYDYKFTESPQIDESKYDSYSNEELYEILKKCDFESSKVIHMNNRRRVIRAIELSCSSKISENKDGNNLVYDALIICLDTQRDVLYNRINRRFEVMIEDGWLDEVKYLKSKYDMTKIKDIGYLDLSNHLDGVMSYEDVKELVSKKTRNYAKRQLTWFRNKLDSTFVMMDYDNLDNTFNEIVNLIDKFMDR